MTDNTPQQDPAAALLAQEQLVARRYRWWPVYLVHERRRLRRIAQAVAGAEDNMPDLTEPDPAEVLAGRAALAADDEGF